MKCFYHSADLDGHCSGAIVKWRHPECEMIGINYGDKFPWDSIQNNEKVFMVDFALQPFKDMIKLFKRCELIWIDHHKSAIEEYEKEQLNEGLYIQGARCHDNSQAGCELTWEYLMETTPSRAVILLSQYDVWNHSNSETLPFQFGLRMEETIPSKNTIEDLWEPLFCEVEDVVESIVDHGELILRYIEGENKKYASVCAFETELDGLKCIAINKMLTNSQLFDSVWDKEKYHAMLTFGFRKGQWTVSLYSDREDIDVSAIAKTRGGGGHKGAAGFQCMELPFKLEE